VTRIVDQPPPTPNDRRPIQALVRADLEERERVGVERYGTPLQAHNGRDALVDAYQEALDLACYLRQAIEERATQSVRRQISPGDTVAYTGMTALDGRPKRMVGTVTGVAADGIVMAQFEQDGMPMTVWAPADSFIFVQTAPSTTVHSLST
jgi:hypothetical protein